MDVEKEHRIEKTWKPITAGILDIIAGAGGIILILLFMVMLTADGKYIVDILINVPDALVLLIPVLTLALFVLSALSIVGGVPALKRRFWTLALIGSIGDVFCSTFLGIVSIVLTVLLKKICKTGNRLL